jgi:hypothetical protein
LVTEELADAAIWSKLTFGLLATITLEVDPFHAYASFPGLCHFLNASQKACSSRVSALSAVVSRSP